MALPIIPGYYAGSLEGRLMGLKMDGKFFKCELGCSFNYDVEMLPCSSVESGYFKESIPGQISWSMSINDRFNLTLEPYTGFQDILSKVKSRERVYLELITRNGISPYFSISGWAWPQSGGLDAQNTGYAQTSTTFTGDGEFTVDWDAFALIINQMPAAAEYPLIIDTGADF